MAKAWQFCAVLLVVPLLPPVAFWLTCFSQSNLDNGVVANVIYTNALVSSGLACMGNAVVTGQMTQMAMLQCVGGRLNEHLVANHGWGSPGACLKATFPVPPSTLPCPLLGDPGLYVFSHEEAKKAPGTVGKNPDLFISVLIKTILDKEMAPADVFPLVIMKNLQDPEHVARRKLIDEGVPALSKPPQFDIVKVPGVISTDLRNESAVESVVSYVLWKSVFDMELDRDGIALLAEWLKVFAPCALNLCPMGSHPKTKEIFLKIVHMTATSKGGERFYEVAKKKGMDPALRLQEMIFITLFAGYKGISDTTNSAIRYYNSATRALFYKDPRAFVLEAARLNPAVAFVGASLEDKTWTLGNGRSYNQKKGEQVFLFYSAANIDPNVFGGPSKSLSYAKDFLPSRENADRLLNWNGELRDILACNTTVGCPKAPRPCPGTRLAVHIATAVATFFVNADDKFDKGAKGEL